MNRLIPISRIQTALTNLRREQKGSGPIPPASVRIVEHLTLETPIDKELGNTRYTTTLVSLKFERICTVTDKSFSCQILAETFCDWVESGMEDINHPIFQYPEEYLTFISRNRTPGEEYETRNFCEDMSLILVTIQGQERVLHVVDATTANSN